MKTRTIPGPRGPFLIPAEPEATSMHAERCCRSVFEGEYSYPRERIEDVRTIVDLGANCGAFAVWAMTWWPEIRNYHGYEPNLDALGLLEANFRSAGGLPGNWDMHPFLVTSRTNDVLGLTDDENWGARRLTKFPREVSRLMHPRDLPAADVLKIDVEGNGGEIAFNYPHWSGVKVCMYESHNAEERATLQSACSYAGLRMVRGNPLAPDCDVRTWAR